MGKTIVKTFDQSVMRQILTDGVSVTVLDSLLSDDGLIQVPQPPSNVLVDDLTPAERAIQDAWWAMWQGRSNVKNGVA